MAVLILRKEEKNQKDRLVLAMNHREEIVKNEAYRIYDYWSTFPKLRQSRYGTKTWDRLVLTWDAMRAGTFFDYKSNYFLKWGGRKFTFIDFVKSVDRFAKAALDESFLPRSKTFYIKLGIADFLYNGYRGESMFLKYLEEEPEPILKTELDRFPELTKFMMEKYKEVTNSPDFVPSTKEQNAFIKAGIRAKDFLAVHPKLLRPDYKNPSDKRLARWIIEAQLHVSKE